MKKIILMCLFFTSLFSDTIYYKEKPSSETLEIKDVVIVKKDSYNLYYKKKNSRETQFISIGKVIKVEDSYGNDKSSLALVSEKKQIKPLIWSNSGTFLKKSADNFGISMALGFVSAAALLNGSFEVSFVSSLVGLNFQFLAISNMKSAGVMLEREQEEKNKAK